MMVMTAMTLIKIVMIPMIFILIKVMSGTCLMVMMSSLLVILIVMMTSIEVARATTTTMRMALIE